jgi:hypothetical protein
MFKYLAIAAALVLAAMSAARADLENENLLIELPNGYKVDFQSKKNNIAMTEIVPVGESVNAWTEMVTVQIFLGAKMTPTQVRQQLEKLWIETCPGASSKLFSEQPVNGYAASVWMMSCPLNKATGKPEITWFRAVQGNDSFYLVQKAFKFLPTADQIAQWTRYLQSVSVCDTRLASRPCPPLKKP